MKSFKIFLLTLTVTSLGFLSAQAYTPPTDGQIGQALANPGMLATLLDDANGEQAADLLVRILARIDSKSDMAQSQKNYLASFYTARTTFLMGGQAQAMAQRLIPRVPENLLPAVVAGLSVGGRGSATFMAALREMVSGDALLQAINNPEIPLTDPIYTLLLQSLGAAQSLPPIVSDSLPPPVVDAPPPPSTPPATRRRPPPAPPVAQPYAGQG